MGTVTVGLGYGQGVRPAVGDAQWRHAGEVPALLMTTGPVWESELSLGAIHRDQVSENGRSLLFWGIRI